VGKLKDAVLNPANIAQLREQLDNQLDEEQRTAPAKARDLDKRIAKLGQQIDKAVGRLPLIDEDLLPDYMARIKEWKEKRANLEADLAKVLNPPERLDLEVAVQAAEEQLQHLDHALASKEPALVRETLREIITKVELTFEARRGKVYQKYCFMGGTIYFRPDEQLDLAGLFTTPHCSIPKTRRRSPGG
jgi:hypothetical protein